MAKSIRISFLALATALIAMAAWAATASAEVVYSAPASSEETGATMFTEISELGSRVKPVGTDRVNPKVSLGLQVTSVEAIEPFEVPMTLRVYEVAAEGDPGAVLAEAQTEAKFTGQGTTQAVWNLTGTTLPSESIVAVSFNGTEVPAAFAEVQFSQPTVGTPVATMYVARDGEPLMAEGEPGEVSEIQPAFTIEAEAPATIPPSGGSSETVPPSTGTTPVVTVPSGPSLALRRHKMKITFPQGTARLGGPGALVQLKCEGSAAARCMGTLTLSILGQTHKVPFSIPKGRKQYVVVPLGDDLERIDSLRSPRAVVAARTLQESGGAVKTSRVLKLRSSAS